MKHKIQWFLLSLLAAAFIYGAFAFGNWELNPKYWSELARVMFSFWVLVIIAIMNIFPNQK